MTPAEYLAAGWTLVPIAPGSKGPTVAGWNRRENCIADPSGLPRITGNVGLAHAYSGTADLDIDDLELARLWLAERRVNVDELLAAPDAVQISSGRPNRAKLLYRLERPRPTAAYAIRRLDDQGKPTRHVVLEFRCGTNDGLTVQDVLPPSIHPDTGAPYRWELGALADWRNPPPIPASLVAAWDELAAPIAPAADDPFITYRPPTGLSLAEARALLERLSADSYDDWRTAGMALQHEFGDAGFELWDQWSSKSAKYAGSEECQRKWDSFGRYRGRPVTMRQVINLAKPAAGTAGLDVLRLVAAPTFNPVRAAIGVGTFRDQPPEPRFIARPILPDDIGALFGAGAAGKTSVGLIVGIHVAVGRSLWGFPIERPGKVLIVSAEDDIARIRHRLHAIGRGLELTDAEAEHLGSNLLVEDVTGKNARLVESDERGNLSQSALVGELVEAYRDAGVVLVLIDPAVSFGPGERFVNDGEQALVTVAARIKRELGCAVGFLHHTGKANARGGVTDQYAGRGGSALSDGMRWVWVLTTHYRDDGEHKAPLGVPTAAIAEGRLLRLHIAKLTDAPRPRDPIWILRTGFTFERVLPQVRTEDEKRRADLHALLAFMRGELEQGIRHTKNSLEGAAKRVGLGRNDVRDLVHVGIELGEIVERELPQDQKRARRQHYLDPGSDPEISAECEA